MVPLRGCLEKSRRGGEMYFRGECLCVWRFLLLGGGRAVRKKRSGCVGIFFCLFLLSSFGFFIFFFFFSFGIKNARVERELSRGVFVFRVSFYFYFYVGARALIFRVFRVVMGVKSAFRGGRGGEERVLNFFFIAVCLFVGAELSLARSVIS